MGFAYWVAYEKRLGSKNWGEKKKVGGRGSGGEEKRTRPNQYI